ncbi:hypothetical protein ACCS64_38640, partial [Rhizobium ruizarguesonis]
DRVHRAEDKSLIEILERHIGDLVNGPSAVDIVTEKVQALISIYLGRKPITVATLAAELTMLANEIEKRHAFLRQPALQAPRRHLQF